MYLMFAARAFTPFSGSTRHRLPCGHLAINETMNWTILAQALSCDVLGRRPAYSSFPINGESFHGRVPFHVFTHCGFEGG